MSENTPALSDLSKGAKIRLSFEGVLVDGDEDRRIVQLQVGEDRLRVQWELSANATEDYDPLVEVLDYGFKPGDVVAVNVQSEHGHRWESLFGVDSGHAGVRWIDSKGEARTVDPSELTLIVRDGFTVRNGLDD